MADRPPPSFSLQRLLPDRAPNASQITGFLTLLISGSILLALTGLTVTAATIALTILAPLLLITSPIWVPAAVVGFFVVAGVLTSCGAAVAALAAGTWLYRYVMGKHPVGSERVDYARSRIADRARDVKEIYLSGRVKDAAPGA